MKRPEDYPRTNQGRLVGNFIVTEWSNGGWRVVENGGTYRMLKKIFATFDAAARRAEAMSK